MIDVRPDTDDRDQRIRKLAWEQQGKDGEIEFDDNAEISEGDDGGAYVRAWVWVDFAGTDLEQKEEDDEETD